MRSLGFTHREVGHLQGGLTLRHSEDGTVKLPALFASHRGIWRRIPVGNPASEGACTGPSGALVGSLQAGALVFVIADQDEVPVDAAGGHEGPQQRSRELHVLAIGAAGHDIPCRPLVVGQVSDFSSMKMASSGRLGGPGYRD